MARIRTVPAREARGVRRFMLQQIKREYGVVPGIAEVLLPDLQLTAAVTWLYNRLHLRRSSPLSRLQRELLATVVNGSIGGAP